MPARLHPAMWLFIAAHALAGGYGLWLGIDNRFADGSALLAVGGPLLIANAVGLALRREVFDRKLSRALAGVMRYGGGFMLIVGSLGMSVGLDGGPSIIGVSLAVAAWGIAFDFVLERSVDAFADSD